LDPTFERSSEDDPQLLGILGILKEDGQEIDANSAMLWNDYRRAALALEDRNNNRFCFFGGFKSPG
jgi:hypothetical protein